MFRKKTKIQVVTKTTIQEKADGALNMFRSAIFTLNESNVEANEIITDNEKTIDALTADNNSLNQLMNSNSKIIDNINNLLGE